MRAVEDERRGFLTGNLAYILWGLLTLFWYELTGLDSFGLIAWRIVWSVVLLAIILSFTRRWTTLRAVLVGGRIGSISIAAVAMLRETAGAPVPDPAPPTSALVPPLPPDLRGEGGQGG